MGGPGDTARRPPPPSSPSQLRAIFRSIVEEKGLLLPTRAEAGGVSVAGVVAARMARRIGVKGFGNAREARNRVDAAIKRWELRVGPAIVEAQVGAAASSRGAGFATATLLLPCGLPRVCAPMCRRASAPCLRASTGP